MQAAWYTQLGSASDVLTVGETNLPLVNAGEVRVRIRASGINPSDVKQRSGWGGLTMRFDRVIPHNDGAGIIEAVGEGVSIDRLHQRVWIYEATLRSGQGTAAEFVTVPAHQAVPLPDNTDFAAGACLGVPAMTAHYSVFCDGVVSGQTILVTGGAGAVGNYAIQLAKWGGATVITTVSSPEKAEVAKAAGADRIFNYKTEDVAAAVKNEFPKGVDRVVDVDFAANLAVNLQILKRNGAIASYASDSNPQPQISFYDLAYKNLRVHTVLVYTMNSAAHAAAARDITAALTEGALKHSIAQRFPLAEIAQAHELMESGRAIGNILLEIP
ncbi:NADPH:quinone reductase [Microcoleus sp. FACHB-1515]|uniref:NADPH:quinone reductase n=1 Tax=Cyanophyceae TaxID=3028117 RepID=UPI001688F4AF|nr:NADPH:quinone reductase [Microcoleus sp. FACHB-1515]MBD2090898.1 NADPH:quinone reductase [Microcoleus sp. FACHB-1515]